MADPTHSYVDPGSGSDSNGGTSDVDAWATVQHALDTLTQGGNGDQINVKAGTADVLTGALDLTTYGNPTNTKPLIIRGYTSTANDGGKGELDGDGSYSIWNQSKKSYINFADMKLGNCGANDVLNFPSGTSYNTVSGCEIHTCTGTYGIYMHFRGMVDQCHIHNISGYGVWLHGSDTRVTRCYFKNGTNDFDWAIRAGTGSAVRRNIISIDGASNGIDLGVGLVCIEGNSILSNGGTGIGINGGWVERLAAEVVNNLVEGFSGVGGKGIGIEDLNVPMFCYRANSVYNCTTNFEDGGYSIHDSDNESLGASPFAKSGSDTFANRLVYFAPVDTGNVHGGAFQ